jgi:hypothetical protein
MYWANTTPVNSATVGNNGVVSMDNLSWRYNDVAKGLMVSPNLNVGCSWSITTNTRTAVTGDGGSGSLQANTWYVLTSDKMASQSDTQVCHFSYGTVGQRAYRVTCMKGAGNGDYNFITVERLV